MLQVIASGGTRFSESVQPSERKTFNIRWSEVYQAFSDILHPLHFS